MDICESSHITAAIHTRPGSQMCPADDLVSVMHQASQGEKQAVQQKSHPQHIESGQHISWEDLLHPTGAEPDTPLPALCPFPELPA